MNNDEEVKKTENDEEIKEEMSDEELDNVSGGVYRDPSKHK
jgi:bacteriocin-like protein